MRFYMNRIVFVMVITLVVMLGALNVTETYGEDDITLEKISGIWWTYDANDIPWAIQFNEDGTFRTAHTHLRLERIPIDEGRFQLEGTSLTLISNKDCEGSCKGLKGQYKVEFTKHDKLLLKAKKDQCSERKGVCSSPWFRVVSK
jgi:hypothetical protein